MNIKAKISFFRIMSGLLEVLEHCEFTHRTIIHSLYFVNAVESTHLKLNVI